MFKVILFVAIISFSISQISLLPMNDSILPVNLMEDIQEPHKIALNADDEYSRTEDTQKLNMIDISGIRRFFRMKRDQSKQVDTVAKQETPAAPPAPAAPAAPAAPDTSATAPAPAPAPAEPATETTTEAPATEVTIAATTVTADATTAPAKSDSSKLKFKFTEQFCLYAVILGILFKMNNQY